MNTTVNETVNMMTSDNMTDDGNSGIEDDLVNIIDISCVLKCVVYHT